MIVGNNIEDISELAWKHNTNYAVVEMVDKLTPAAIDVVKSHSMILHCPTEIMNKYTESEFSELLDEIGCCVLFVQDESTFDPLKYDALLRKFSESSFEYIRNANNDGLEELELILTEEVLKGHLNGNNII